MTSATDANFLLVNDRTRIPLRGMTQQVNPKVLKFGLVTGVVVLPFLILLNIYGKPELTYPVAAATCAIGFAVRAHWALRAHWWFWITIIAIICLHVPLILLIPWKAGWVPAPVTMLASLADLALLIGLLGLIERMMTRES